MSDGNGAGIGKRIVRVRFSKTGAIKYLGHLDMLRYFQKAIRRADLPVKYSEGYHPHMLLSFAMPLGVGATSVGEYLDMELVCDAETGTNAGALNSDNADFLSTEEIASRLNAEMVGGVSILSAAYLPEKATSAMASVAAASYIVRTTCSDISDYSLAELRDAIREFYEKSERILVVKKTKKAEREIDLKPLVYRFLADEDEQGVFFDLLLSAGSENNVKPELLLGAFFRYLETSEETEVRFLIHRTDLYRMGNDGELISLGD